MPGRRMALACVFKYWMVSFPREKNVFIESKNGRRGCVWVRYEGGFDFLLISDFCDIMKGKQVDKKNGFALI